MTRPKVLYHGSQDINIEEFEPRSRSFRDPSEGPVVFATPDKAIATMFIVPSNDTWTHSGTFGGVRYFVCSDRRKFEKLDTGGVVYIIDSEGFEYDPNKGLGDKEWTCNKPVRPIGEEVVKSALDAMIDLKVQVFFVDKETFNKIDKSSDHGNQILRNSVSENMRKKKNIIILPRVFD